MVPMDINSQVEELIKLTLKAEQDKRKKMQKKRQWLKGAEDTISSVIKSKLSGKSGDC